jgi:hypothetical protein
MTREAGVLGKCHPDSFDYAQDRLRGGICSEFRVHRDSSTSLRMTWGRVMHLGYVIPTEVEGSVQSPERFFDFAQNDMVPGDASATCHPDSFDYAQDRLRGGSCSKSREILRLRSE